MNTLKELKSQYIVKMIESGIESAAFDFNYILQEVFDVSSVDLLTQPDLCLATKDENKFIGILERYIKGEPLQYIIGHTWFMSSKFKVAPGVLIPRSDTEVVCEKGIQYLKSYKNAAILDMCCGSGCIGLSIAEAYPDSHVTLCDISPVAIEITSENASSLGLDMRTKILKGNLFEALSGDKTHNKFQLIVSNPPYISREIIKGLDARVRDHEPVLALDGGEDGLDFYRIIVNSSPAHLLEGSMLLFETGYDQTEEVAELMKAAGGYKNIEIFKDYGGNFRGVCGIYKGASL